MSVSMAFFEHLSCNVSLSRLWNVLGESDAQHLLQLLSSLLHLKQVKTESQLHINTTKQPTKSFTRALGSLPWSKRICPLPLVPRPPGRTRPSSPPRGFLSHLSSAGGKRNVSLSRRNHNFMNTENLFIPKCLNYVTHTLLIYFGSTDRVDALWI